VGLFYFPPVFRQQFFIVKEVPMSSVLLSVTCAERQMYSTCPNSTCILFNYTYSSIGKSVSNCSSTTFSMVVSAYSQGLALSLFAVFLTNLVSISLETRILGRLSCGTGILWLIHFFS